MIVEYIRYTIENERQREKTPMKELENHLELHLTACSMSSLTV